MNTFTRTIALGAAGGAVVLGGVTLAAPAQAGGGGDAYGSTYALCDARLDAAVDEARAAGMRITDVTPCSKASNGIWYGSYGYTSG